MKKSWSVAVALMMAGAVYSVSSYAGMMGEESLIYPAGFVIGGDVGYGYLSTQESNLIPPMNQLSQNNQFQSHQIGSVIGGGHVGYDYLLWNRTVAGFELGYKYLGKSSFASNASVLASPFSTSSTEHIVANVNQQAIDLLVTGRLYVWNGLSIETKAGGAFVNSASHNTWTLTNSSTGVLQGLWNFNPSVWRLEPEFAIGGGWLVGHGVSLVGMYTHIFGNSFAANPSMNGANANANNTPGYGFAGAYPVDTLSVGFTYHGQVA